MSTLDDLPAAGAEPVYPARISRHESFDEDIFTAGYRLDAGLPSAPRTILPTMLEAAILRT